MAEGMLAKPVLETLKDRRDREGKGRQTDTHTHNQRRG